MILLELQKIFVITKDKVYNLHQLKLYKYKRLKNTVAEHSVISITADRLEELLKTEDLSNITMKELIYLRKMKLDGADIAAMAEKLSIESDIVAKLLDIIIF